MMPIHGRAELSFIDDTGYTKICPHCTARYGEDAATVGRPRTLEVKNCQKCSGKYFSDYDKRTKYRLRETAH